MSVRPAPRAHRRFSAPEAIADLLRDRILRGDVPDGGALPKQDDLAEEYGVTRAAIREACRILEAEGLLRVVRGNVGGSIVHVPTPATAAYTVGLVLQAREAKLADVGLAVEWIEPLIAQLCAERPDRLTTVLPALRAAQEQLTHAIDTEDAGLASQAARRWHETLVDSCGNEAIRTVVGVLEAVWSAHARESAIASHDEPFSGVLDAVRRVYDEHQEVQALIEAGDGAAAASMTRRHLATAHIHPPRPVEGPVLARTIRDIRPNDR